MRIGKNGWIAPGKAAYLKFKVSGKTVMATSSKTINGVKKMLCSANGKSFVVPASMLKK